VELARSGGKRRRAHGRNDMVEGKVLVREDEQIAGRRGKMLAKGRGGGEEREKTGTGEGAETGQRQHSRTQL